MVIWACRYSKGCDGGDVIDVIRYMKNYGLPDESCQIYSATDYTKYGKHAKKCPADGYCMNCMPLKVRSRGVGIELGLAGAAAGRVQWQCAHADLPTMPGRVVAG